MCRWPRATRWSIACSAAIASSHDTVGKSSQVDRRVDEHDREVALGELGVVAVRCVLLGVQAAGEHDAGHLLVEAAGRRRPPR